jgi:hypothetical protein
MPPVVAFIETNAAVINPTTEQVYATGAAAVNILLDEGQPVKEPPTDLSGDKKLMFFGTTTTGGLKVGFTAQFPDSFLFGFRRKEYSLIPLGTKPVDDKDRDGDGKPDIIDIYPSVLAYLKIDAKASSQEETAFFAKQFFATGEAAALLAQEPEVRAMIRKKREEAFGTYFDQQGHQNKQALAVLECQVRVGDDQLKSLVDNANENGLFKDKETYSILSKSYDTAAGMPVTTVDEVFAKQEAFNKTRRNYTKRVNASIDADSEKKGEALAAHRKFVCELANN